MRSEGWPPICLVNIFSVAFILRFSKLYFLVAGGLLVVEVVIACYAHDGFIRPYAGDFLATVLLYCLVRSVVNTRISGTVAAVMLVSYLIEGLQYVHLLDYLGGQYWRMARIVLGSHFSWADMLAYTLVALAVFVVEQLRIRSGPGASRQRAPAAGVLIPAAQPITGTVAHL